MRLGWRTGVVGAITADVGSAVEELSTLDRIVCANMIGLRSAREAPARARGQAAEVAAVKDRRIGGDTEVAIAGACEVAGSRG